MSISALDFTPTFACEHPAHNKEIDERRFLTPGHTGGDAEFYLSFECPCGNKYGRMVCAEFKRQAGFGILCNECRRPCNGKFTLL